MAADIPSGRESALLPATAIAVLSGALYVWTLMPGLGWGDDAELQRLAVVGGTRSDAHVHPLWLWIARIVARLPVGVILWRVNLTSALSAAITIGLVFLLADRLTRRRDAAAIAALALAVSHTLWLHAVRAEVYSVYTMCFALTLLAFVTWRERPRAALLVATGLLAGATLLSHMLIVTAYPGLAVGIWLSTSKGTRASGSTRVRALALFAMSGFAGSALFVAVAGLNPVLHPIDGKGGPLTILDPPRAVEVARWALYTLYQFPLGTPLALWGLWRMVREDAPLALALALVLLGDVTFTLSFRVIDQYVFYLPAHVIEALFIAWGIAALPYAWRRPWPVRAALVATLVLVPPVAYRVAPVIASRSQREVVSPRTLPGRDNARYFLYPPKQDERSAERYAREALRVLPESALVVADWAPLSTLRYLQIVEHARPDVELLPSRTDHPNQADSLAVVGRYRRLFLADDDPMPYYDMQGYRRHFEIVPLGPVFMLLPRGGGKSRN